MAESITIRLYGKEVEVPRGSMSDSEWADLQKKAEDAKLRENELKSMEFGRTATDEQVKAAEAGAYEVTTAKRDWERANNAVAKAKKDGDWSKVDKEDLILIARGAAGEKLDSFKPMPPKDDEWQTVDEYKAKTAPVEKGGSHGIKRFVEQGLKGGLDERPPAVGQAVDMGGGLREQRTQPGALPFNPQQQAPDAGAAPQALPFNPRQTPDAGIIPPSGGTPDAGALKPQQLPAVPAWVDTRSPTQVFQELGQTAGSLMGPSAPPQAAPQAQPPSVAPGTPVAPAEVSHGFSSSGQVRGTTTPGVEIPQYPPKGMDAQSKQLMQERAGALTEAAEIGSAAKQKMANAEADYAYKLQEHQMRLQLQAEAGQMRVDNTISKMQELQRVLADPAKTPDPNRYWETHDKTMFAVGLGLLAASGRDIGGIVNSVQNAITRDIQLQKDAFEAPKNAARESLDVEAKMYGMMRQQGLDAFEAEKTSMTLYSQQVQSQIRQIADASESELVKSNARDMIARLQQEDQQRMLEVSQHAKALGIQEYNAKTQRWEVSQKIAARQGGTGRLTVKQQNALVDIKQYASSLIQQLDEAKRIIQRDGTFEAFGSHKEDQNRLYNGISIASAKLVDPESVARESEVKIARDSLGLNPNDMGMRNQTAEQIINNWQRYAYEQAKTGLKARLQRAGEPLPDEEIDRELANMGITPGGTGGVRMGAPR